MNPLPLPAAIRMRLFLMIFWLLLVGLLLPLAHVQALSMTNHGPRGLCMTTTTASVGTTATTARVAVVTGASRGIGRGIALELGSQGYIVYCLGRSSRQPTSSTTSAMYPSRPVAPGLDVTVESAAEQVTARGGTGIGISCDLSRDGTMETILEQVYQEHGRFDVLVCAAYTTPPSEQESLRGEFWKQSMEMWDAIHGLGLRQVYAACRAAVPYMIETASRVSSSSPSAPPPLICLVSSFGGKSYTFNVAYGIGKAAIDRMAVDMSYQLKKYGVATTSLYPGVVKTEANLQMVADGTWDAASGGLNLLQGETPEFSGRAVVQLASLDKESMMARSGNVEVVAELAKEFGFTDIDGRQPPSIRSLQYLIPNFVFPQIEKESGGKPIPQWMKDAVPDIVLPWSVFSSGPPPEADTR